MASQLASKQKINSTTIKIFKDHGYRRKRKGKSQRVRVKAKK